MATLLRLGVTSPQSIQELHRLMLESGIPLSPDMSMENFDYRWKTAVELFQSNSVDRKGVPLETDGIVGPETWWALRNIGASRQAHTDPSEARSAMMHDALHISKTLCHLQIIDYRQSVPRNPRKPNIPIRELSDVTTIVIHTADSDMTVDALCAYAISPNNHISAGGCPIPMYSIFIEASGQAYLLNSAEMIGWHAGDFNSSSFGISYGRRVSDKPASYYKTPEIEAALITAAHNACLFFGITDVTFHRLLPKTGYNDYNGDGVKDQNEPFRKTCPGMAWDVDDFRKKVILTLQVSLNNSIGVNLPVDGMDSAELNAALQAFHRQFGYLDEVMLGTIPGVSNWTELSAYAGGQK